MDDTDDHSAADEARWDAVKARDAAADGAFVYGVRTTGVFCRPSCTSRAARRANVRFYPDAAAARAAGFRPCLRCRPVGESAEIRQAALVDRACRMIEAAETMPDLDALAREAGTVNPDGEGTKAAAHISVTIPAGGETVLRGRLSRILPGANRPTLRDVDEVIAELAPTLPKGSSIAVRGQVASMRESFAGLQLGLVFAVVRVYLLMVVNFESWTDPLIIILALPGALAGIAWLLFATGTTLSVPSPRYGAICTASASRIAEPPHGQVSAPVEPLERAERNAAGSPPGTDRGVKLAPV